jgi:hypothetical protein
MTQRTIPIGTNKMLENTAINTGPTCTIVTAMKRRKKNNRLGRKDDKYGFPSDRKQASE